MEHQKNGIGVSRYPPSGGFVSFSTSPTISRCLLSLILLLLPVPLGVNLRGERILEPERNLIYGVHQPSQKNTSRLAEPQGGAQEAHGAPVIHGRRSDIEREARNDVVHQDTKIISQIRPRDAKRPHAREHEDVTARDEAYGETL